MDPTLTLCLLLAFIVFDIIMFLVRIGILKLIFGLFSMIVSAMTLNVDIPLNPYIQMMLFILGGLLLFSLWEDWKE